MTAILEALELAPYTINSCDETIAHYECALRYIYDKSRNSAVSTAKRAEDYAYSKLEQPSCVAAYVYNKFNFNAMNQ